ncbi:unnamed protein product [Parnassius apollo]|uniref:(apollo) hypothetical protein n=1 Tax=Parnassius apollo TaxID=110799 RepID=A0A8S3XRG3_PARAO|nr:unnamed protein product [Parnassius apollo]
MQIERDAARIYFRANVLYYLWLWPHCKIKSARFAQSCTGAIGRMSRASSPARSGAAEELENDDIDIEQLITLMHRRSPLWDKFNPKYHDRILKARLWEEIYQDIYFSWEQCSVVEKENKKGKYKELMCKKNGKILKDTYFKEVAADKKGSFGSSRKEKKRPYIHMGALSFLATQKSMRDTTNNIKDIESTNSNAEYLTNQSDEETDTEASRNRRLKTSMRKKD